MQKRFSTSQRNHLRIIGGKWRERTFCFPELAIRPTPNRVRETLFNWLAPIIVGSRCLDLFAGSGALGFEALSRGASTVTFVDHQLAVVDHLKNTAVLLKTENSTVLCLEIPSNLFPRSQSFDIVFLDPPFMQDLIGPCCTWLEEQKFLAKNAYVYIEAEKNLRVLPVPASWKHLKNKTAGQVSYHLLRV